MCYVSYQKGQKGINYDFEVWFEVPEREYNAFDAKVLLAID